MRKKIIEIAELLDVDSTLPLNEMIEAIKEAINLLKA